MERTRQRTVGLVLGVGSVVSVLLMMRHPSVQAHGVAQAIAEIGEKATLNRIVHGGLIGVMILVFAGFLGLAELLGPQLMRVRAAVLFHGCGVVFMLGAALVSGFVVTDFASGVASMPADKLDDLAPIFVLCHTLNQVLAKAGTLALSVALCAWSCALFSRGGCARILAGLGLLVGILPILGLLSGHLRLDVHGMGLVVFAQALWTISVGVWCATVVESK